MAISEVRQRARRSAAERMARLRQERADLVRKREGWAAEALTALAERDALVVDAERRAGAGLHALMESGLSLAEAAAWADLATKEAARLVRLVAVPPVAAGAASGTSAS